MNLYDAGEFMYRVCYKALLVSAFIVARPSYASHQEAADRTATLRKLVQEWQASRESGDDCLFRDLHLDSQRDFDRMQFPVIDFLQPVSKEEGDADGDLEDDDDTVDDDAYHPCDDIKLLLRSKKRHAAVGKIPSSASIDEKKFRIRYLDSHKRGRHLKRDLKRKILRLGVKDVRVASHSGTYQIDVVIAKESSSEMAVRDLRTKLDHLAKNLGGNESDFQIVALDAKTSYASYSRSAHFRWLQQMAGRSQGIPDVAYGRWRVRNLPKVYRLDKISEGVWELTSKP